jgi:hypothetical protein
LFPEEISLVDREDVHNGYKLLIPVFVV